MAALFDREGQAINQMLSRIRRQMGTLKGGQWIGRGADKFYQEMDSEVLPSVQRLASAMDNASRVTTHVSRIMKQAEEDAARILKADGTGGRGPAPGGTGPGDPGGGGGAGGDGGGASEAEQAADRMLEDLSPEVRQIANQSPTLQNQLQELEQEGWMVVEGAPGRGSYADAENKVLVIEGGDTAVSQASGIAHEVGHARYGEKPYHAPTDEMTRQEYIDANVRESLLDEGSAQLNSATVRDEIQANGGPDIGIPGSQTEDYQSVYEQYRDGDISRDEAVSQMADLMGNEVTSNTGENYRDYYGKPYAEYWDEHVAPDRED